MNGMHDLGGMQCMGPVDIEKNEPVFHAEWERRVFAMTLASAWSLKWNVDMGRWSRERMPPAEYLPATYYERWLFGLEKLLVELGAVTRTELASGHAEGPTTLQTLHVPEVETYLRNRRHARRGDDVPAKFKAGDRVVARNLHPVGHTRLPRYARGKRGVINRDHGVFVFADTNAMTRNEKPQHCYSVRFAAQELWGPAASARDSVNLDLWDDHLDPA